MLVPPHFDLRLSDYYALKIRGTELLRNDCNYLPVKGRYDYVK